MRSVRSWPTERSKGTPAGKTINSLVWWAFAIVCVLIIL